MSQSTQQLQHRASSSQQLFAQQTASSSQELGQVDGDGVVGRARAGRCGQRGSELLRDLRLNGRIKARLVLLGLLGEEKLGLGVRLGLGEVEVLGTVV